MKKKFQLGRSAPGFPATRLRKAVLMSAFIMSGLVIMTCWGYAGESSVEYQAAGESPSSPSGESALLPYALADDDTCNCKKTPQQSGDIGCDSIKVITFQGGPDCVFATTIYEDSLCAENSSGISKYLAFGFWDSTERRILLRFNLEYIVDSTCINPPLALVAQFDSVRFTLYTVDSCNVDTCGDKTRQFFVGRLLQDWNVGTNGKGLSACQVLDCGSPASDGSVNWYYPWKQPGGDYIFSTDDNVPRNVPLSQTSPGTCIDSVMFVCHRPSPYNRYIKQTIKEWISAPYTNFGWVIMPDSSQRAIHPNSALLFHSPSAENPALRPKLTMYFTAGVDRDDDPVCGTVSYIKLPGCPAAKGRE